MAAETGKQLRSSGSSSDESDSANDEGVGTLRRSFECTYCKRGFTNAQALGGHMNIHRKDRSKTKKDTTVTKNTNSAYSDDPTYMMSYRQIAPPSTSSVDIGYGNWEAQRTMLSSHHMYRPAAMSGALNLLPGGYHPEPIRQGHEMGSNLSWSVGAGASNYVAWNNNNIEDDIHEEQNNEDVDLELRLGPS